ncbi:MAG: serine hydrolase domain-containing protein [bacterium]|nr:serine hydrolase domain-containing protein [bacterium]
MQSSILQIARISMSIIFIVLFGCNQNRTSKIDRMFQAYSGDNVPGAALLVIKDNEPILTRTFGMASVENKIPVTVETNFRLASVTKQFTAMCIMILAEQGKLSYQQALQDIFPDFPAYGQNIRIDHLIHHTSGLIDYESLIPDTATIQVLDKDVLEMMRSQDSTYFTPGTQYRYSNSAYAVLAMIVEKISGLSFADFLTANIFNRLYMTETVAYQQGISKVKNRAFGYTDEDAAFISRDQSLTSAVLGDGGIYSSLMDLFKWDQALYRDQLVSFESLKLAFMPDTLTDGTSTGYGFGWRIDEFSGQRRLHHTGQTCGFTTIIQRYPDMNFSIIILTNRHRPMLDEIADQIAEIYL